MVQTQRATGSVVKIIGIHHSGIPCNNLDRAVDFYTRVLGMEIIKRSSSSDPRGHFLGGNTPPEVSTEDPIAESEYAEYVANYQRHNPGHVPAVNFMRLRAGSHEVVLFERLQPVEADTHLQNGIFHQSFHVSKEDLDRLAELKARGDSDIRFHNGPVLRWPHGRAMYLWDSEGNYLELESEEDLPAQFGLRK